MTARHATPFALKARTRRGFTIIELLLALIISTLILGTGAAVFSTTIGSWQQARRNFRLTQSARSTADLIERYLRGALPSASGGSAFTGTDLTEGTTAGHELEFFTAAAGRLPRSQPGADHQRVKLTFDPLATDGLMLQIDSFPDEVHPEQADATVWGYQAQLTPLAVSFKMLYFNGEKWLEEWTDSALPQAVEFHLTCSGPSNNPDKPDVYTVSRMFALPMSQGETTLAAAQADAQTAAGGQPGQTDQTGQADQPRQQTPPGGTQ